MMEQRLKSGDLKAVVATASLELGIDIGSVDLVCQIGSPRRIATFLQRVGRSGHALGLTPHGALFPTSLDELVECAAMVRAVERGDLDRIRQPQAPIEILAQQIVAEAASEEEWGEDDLYRLMRRAAPYAELERSAFEETVEMLATGNRRGRRAVESAAAPGSDQRGRAASAGGADDGDPQRRHESPRRATTA